MPEKNVAATQGRSSRLRIQDIGQDFKTYIDTTVGGRAITTMWQTTSVVSNTSERKQCLDLIKTIAFNTAHEQMPDLVQKAIWGPDGTYRLCEDAKLQSLMGENDLLTYLLGAWTKRMLPKSAFFVFADRCDLQLTSAPPGRRARARDHLRCKMDVVMCDFVKGY
jgi:hypothetical protein